MLGGRVAAAELGRSAAYTDYTEGNVSVAVHPPALVVELHGTMREVMCLDCGERGPMEPVLDRLRAGEDDPPCRRRTLFRSCPDAAESANAAGRDRRGGAVGARDDVRPRSFCVHEQAGGRP